MVSVLQDQVKQKTRHLKTKKKKKASFLFWNVPQEPILFQTKNKRTLSEIVLDENEQRDDESKDNEPKTKIRSVRSSNEETPLLEEAPPLKAPKPLADNLNRPANPLARGAPRRASLRLNAKSVDSNPDA